MLVVKVELRPDIFSRILVFGNCFSPGFRAPQRGIVAGRAKTFEPVEPPWQAIGEWISDDDADPAGDFFDQSPVRARPVEICRPDGSILLPD